MSLLGQLHLPRPSLMGKHLALEPCEGWDRLCCFRCCYFDWINSVSW
uniref:Uncharacterized protein n=1 Tax=Picea glauca TaxID=3330 RepID=A0A117NGK7_PICGL|nr:hypothetical protein ABT39_MTgene6393 [Picea glauca]QHR86278.1 hypothetical protein Q903MT_gene277 [Picea sitchensis]